VESFFLTGKEKNYEILKCISYLVYNSYKINKTDHNQNYRELFNLMKSCKEKIDNIQDPIYLKGIKRIPGLSGKAAKDIQDCLNAFEKFREIKQNSTPKKAQSSPKKSQSPNKYSPKVGSTAYYILLTLYKYQKTLGNENRMKKMDIVKSDFWIDFFGNPKYDSFGSDITTLENHSFIMVIEQPEKYRLLEAGFEYAEKMFNEHYPKGNKPVPIDEIVDDENIVEDVTPVEIIKVDDEVEEISLSTQEEEELLCTQEEEPLLCTQEEEEEIPIFEHITDNTDLVEETEKEENNLDEDPEESKDLILEEKENEKNVEIVEIYSQDPYDDPPVSNESKSDIIEIDSQTEDFDFPIAKNTQEIDLTQIDSMKDPKIISKPQNPQIIPISQNSQIHPESQIPQEIPQILPNSQIIPQMNTKILLKSQKSQILPKILPKPQITPQNPQMNLKLLFTPQNSQIFPTFQNPIFNEHSSTLPQNVFKPRKEDLFKNPMEWETILLLDHREKDSDRKEMIDQFLRLKVNVEKCNLNIGDFVIGFKSSFHGIFISDLIIERKTVRDFGISTFQFKFISGKHQRWKTEESNG
jgi:hypothetical protein